MNDITIIVPVHEYNDEVKTYLDKALASVSECRKHYKDGKLPLFFILAPGIDPTQVAMDPDGEYAGYIVKEEGPTDFCSMINAAVDKVETEHFSILEFDDEYTPKWFKFANQFSYGNEDVSIYIPLNIARTTDDTDYQYLNEIALSKDFCEDFGFIDRSGLDSWCFFNLTGAIFNTKDFIEMNKYKASIQVAFNYELMLRYANLNLRMMVVPKEGYLHTVGRKESLAEKYTNDMTQEEIEEWYALAKREFQYMKDRNKGINNKEKETLK